MVAFNLWQQVASPPWRALPFGLVARFCASTPKTTGRVQPAVPRRQPLAACNAPPTPAKPRSSLTARPPRRLAATPSATCAPVRSVLHSIVAMSYNAPWPFETKDPPAHRAGLVCGLVDAPGCRDGVSEGLYFISIPTSLGLRTTSFWSIFAMWSFAAVPSP